MGTWGDQPWENDAAADWFGDLMRATRFAEQVAAGLNADIEDSPEVVRAAAHVVFLFGHTYLWPIDRLETDLQLAADRLQQLLDRQWQPAAPLRKELRAVNARLKRRTNKQGYEVAEVRPARSPARTSIDNKHGKSTLRIAWTHDLATLEQRKNASAYRWGILPPEVTLLRFVGNKQLLAGTAQHLRLIDTTSGKAIRDFVQPGEKSTGISDSGLVTQAGVFVVVQGEKTVVRKIPDGDEMFAVKVARCGTRAISPDGRLLLLLTWSGTLHVYDIKQGIERFQFQHEPPKRAEDACCAVSPDGQRAASSWQGSVCFWDLQAGTLIRRQRNKYPGVRFAANGKEAITRGGTGLVLWDVETGKKIRAITRADGIINDHLISPESRYVCEVAPFQRHQQQSEVYSVRDWKEGDAPYAGTPRVDFVWRGDDQLVSWRDVTEPGHITTCEIRLWTLNPLKLAGAMQAEPPLLPLENESEPARRAVQFCRIVLDDDQTMIFAGDRNAHIYAYLVDS